MSLFNIEFINDKAVVIYQNAIHNCAINSQLQDKFQALAVAAKQLDNLVDVVLGLNSLTLFFNSYSAINLAQLKEFFTDHWNQQINTTGTHYKIPVIYGGETGPDLEYVANYHQLTVAQLVELHTAPIYKVLMLGFQAGFPYLEGLNPLIATPRRATPRLKINKGSVGIAGPQTGIYPLESPGGWQIIGVCELELFNPSNSPPTLLAPNDTIQFTVAEIRG